MLTLSAMVAVAVLIAITVGSAVAPGRLRGVLMGIACILAGVRGSAVWTAAFASPVVPAAVAAAERAELLPADAEEKTGDRDEQPTAARADSQGAPAELESGVSSDLAKDEAVSEQPEQPLEFVTHIQYLTPNRPDWLEQKPSIERGTHHIAVKAGPHFRMRQCQLDLEEELKSATSEFINDYLEHSRAATLIGFQSKEIRRQLVRQTFEEQLMTSVGPMHQAHALLEFDASFLQDLGERWQRVKAACRLIQTASGSGIVLLLVATLFAYFKLDTATKGYYTGRLQFAAAAAILALVTVSVWVARSIPWM